MYYNIGDKVVYPMHGAGVIEAIEEKEILGQCKDYYIMKMPMGNMKVMIPMSNVDEIGIREIVEESVADDVLLALQSYNEDENTNWNKRYRENMIKIKTGDIYEVAHVVKMLMSRDKCKGLSTGERKMLSNAKQILISELVLSKGMPECEIESMVIESIFTEAK